MVGLGGWAATTEFAGAVIAPGQVVVNSNVKKVQHPTGGIVGELRARDGDKVKAGDVVVRLDDVQTRANLAIVTKALDEMAARQAREETERDGIDEITFPADLLARINDADVAKAVNGERRQFEIRRTRAMASAPCCGSVTASRGDAAMMRRSFQEQPDRVDPQGGQRGQ